MYGLYNLIGEIIDFFVNLVIITMLKVFPPNLMTYFMNTGFNIYLFSDTGWFTEPIKLNFLIQIIAYIFMLIFVLRLLWKGTKKFITMIFGVFRV